MLIDAGRLASKSLYDLRAQVKWTTPRLPAAGGETVHTSKNTLVSAAGARSREQPCFPLSRSAVGTPSQWLVLLLSGQALGRGHGHTVRRKPQAERPDSLGHTRPRRQASLPATPVVWPSSPVGVIRAGKAGPWCPASQL